jgi:hypothetical protein
MLQLEVDGNYVSPLRCSLNEYPVGQAPPYICLSYCWGANRKVRDTIDVEGKALFITDTVSIALRWIRAWKYEQQQTSESTSVIVWIDYVCINQADIAERSSQVSHMKALYSQAELVLVYLGSQEQGSENIPELYTTLREAHDRFYQASKASEIDLVHVKIKDLSLREQNGIGLPSPTDPIWDSHRAFLKRPWFLRTWIIQEAVLAREILFVCGAWGVHGHHLTNGWHIIIAENLRHLFSNASLEDHLKETPAESQAITQLLFMLNTGMGEDVKKSHSLIDLLQTSRGALVTDPRDYIYGLLGITSDYYREKIVVDYAEPVTETYKRAARIVVEHGEGAKLLHNLHGLDTDLDLPSWVPDWSSKHFPSFSVAPMLGNASETFDIPYVCAGGLPGPGNAMQVHDSGKSLHCSGYIVDTVDKLTNTNIEDYFRPAGKEGEPARSDASTAYRFLYKCSSDLAQFLAAKSAYPPNSHEEVIWRTLIWNRGRSEQRKASMQYEELYKTFKEYTEWRILTPESVVVQARPKTAALDKEVGFLIPGKVAANILLQEYDAVGDQAEKFANWATSICYQMRRCGTAKGYVGHVPHGVRVGDLICVIAGAAVPFTLRKVAGGYRVIGQCYLHGMMEGEALRESSLQKESIVLL